MKHWIFMLGAMALQAQQVSLSDTLTNAVGGGAFTGRITVTLNAPGNASPLYYSTTSLTGWQAVYCLGVTGSDCTTTTAAGVFAATLYANSTITPAGTSYSARFTPAKGSPWTETWVVTPSTTTLRQVRSSTVPTPTTTFTAGQLSLGAGSLVYGSSAGVGTALAAGTNGQVLALSGGYPGWTTNISGNAATATALASSLTSGAILKGQGTGVPASSILSESALTSTYDSTARTVVAITDGGVSRIVQSRPATESKRIVIAGSSVASGSGASSYAASWAGNFEAAMQAKGYTTYNVSISANSTFDMIARFWTDIAPLKPDVVIHATGVSNDGYSFDSYKANIMRLIKMTEQIGARAVIVGQHPNDSLTSAQYKTLKDLYLYLDSLGVTVWDFLTPLAAESTGAFISGLSSDGTHPNTTGHQAMYQSIPLTSIDAPKTKDAASFPFSGWTLGSDTSTAPLTATLDRSAQSWSMGAWLKSSSTTGQVYLSAAGYSSVPRVRCNSSVYQFAANTETISSSVSCVDGQWHQVAMALNNVDGYFRLYIDGSLIGSVARVVTGNATAFTWLGDASATASNAQTATVAAPFVYRTPLFAEDYAEIYASRYPRKSLDVLMPLTQYPRSKAANIATSTVDPAVNSTAFSLTRGTPDLALFASSLSTTFASGGFLYGAGTGVPSASTSLLYTTGSQVIIGGTSTMGTSALQVYNNIVVPQVGSYRIRNNANTSSLNMASAAGDEMYFGDSASGAAYLQAAGGVALKVAPTTRSVLIGTTSDDGSNRLQVNGNLRIAGAAEPTCSSTTRGTIALVAGGTGVKDTVRVCAKDAADAYAYRAIY